MSETERHDAEVPREPGGGPAAALARMPLAVRMFFYGAFFLAAVLVLLPWLAYRLDLLLPGWHLEIGWLRLLGVMLFVVCLSIYIGASYRLSRLGRGAYVEFDPPREFVSSGPFRWCRNPIAACVVGMLLGEALALSSTGVFLLFLLAVPLAHAQVVFIEEPRLRERFGQAYVDYLEQVPRWVPRPPRKGAS